LQVQKGVGGRRTAHLMKKKKAAKVGLEKESWVEGSTCHRGENSDMGRWGEISAGKE